MLRSKREAFNKSSTTKSPRILKLNLVPWCLGGGFGLSIVYHHSQPVFRHSPETPLLSVT
jgi:hypothetical protein